jgi:hypothetical protein
VTQPTMGRLVVNSSFNPMAFLLAFTGPKVMINGYATKVRWGQAPFDLPAGNYHLRVSVRYLGDFCPADLSVTVYPGQVVPVYSRPAAVMGKKTRGMPVIVALNIIAFVLMILLLVIY